MAARTGVRCLFGSYVKQFYSTSRLSRTFYLFVPKYVSHTTQPMRSHALFSNVSYKIHNRNASTAVQTEESVSGCPICSRILTFTYKDVLLLAQFISPEGNILNRRITGVCRKQQRKLEKAIEISRRLGLIPRKPPALIHKENVTT
ncbi:28S ribosomal S18a, mitochondrial-like [Paramuricea clavata]|uniref:28S ribosomal S18a, mitochondrial-like n=1 Tax=Paramuricea clavata TaxID=317549 RepID=A0A7D9EVD5_PARCT|nr:28S ribosomal S18a, mitochondrial-like [Paramuricea clavata]